MDVAGRGRYKRNIIIIVVVVRIRVLMFRDRICNGNNTRALNTFKNDSGNDLVNNNAEWKNIRMIDCAGQDRSPHTGSVYFSSSVCTGRLRARVSHSRNIYVGPPLVNTV